MKDPSPASCKSNIYLTQVWSLPCLACKSTTDLLPLNDITTCNFPWLMKIHYLNFDVVVVDDDGPEVEFNNDCLIG